MPGKRPDNTSRANPTTTEAVTAFKHPSKRKNIPAAGLEAQGVIKEAPRIRYEYNPHLPPVLRSAPHAVETDQLPELLQTARQRALTEEEARELAAALRKLAPWLEWAGKREKPWFEVEPVALHIHERVSTQAILRVLAREDVQRDLFADPRQTYAQAVQFYQHDVDWANRMILGDSLQVMASLVHRENLAGKVQMIYIDLPYGIRFASNFQPQLGRRDVKDREQDLTREPEMVKAYRDTWTLGIHSYLAYLRDRLAMARELLADTGSIFVQISDENLHRVRCVMNEVFGATNFVAQIRFRTTSSLRSQFAGPSVNYLLWYARDKANVKYLPIFRPRGFEDDVGGHFTRALLLNGTKHVFTTEERENISLLPKGAHIYRHDNLTSQSGGKHSSFPVEFQYKPVGSTANIHFKTIKPVQATEASHLNFVACDTESWEQAAVFQLEKLAKEGIVHCYARNDHLEFTIPYELYGLPHVYEPDFLVKLTTDVTVILEVKGQTHGDTAVKHQAAQRWIKAVNHWGELGEWDFLVCWEPQRLPQTFQELNAVRQQRYLSGLLHSSSLPTN